MRGSDLILLDEVGGEPKSEKLIFLLRALEVLICPTHDAKGLSNILAYFILGFIIETTIVIQRITII